MASQVLYTIVATYYNIVETGCLAHALITMDSKELCTFLFNSECALNRKGLGFEGGASKEPCTFLFNSECALNRKGLGVEGGAVYHMQYPGIGGTKITKIQLLLPSSTMISLHSFCHLDCLLQL